VTLVTFHKTTFNKINDLRGGGLQVVGMFRADASPILAYRHQHGVPKMRLIAQSDLADLLILRAAVVCSAGSVFTHLLCSNKKDLS
jgi:hypothetical protein